MSCLKEEGFRAQALDTHRAVVPTRLSDVLSLSYISFYLQLT